MNNSNLEMETDCHHVAKFERSFIERMRFHQSWYRSHLLKVPPGPNPAARGAVYGNMLRDVDGRAGLNFLNPTIHTWVEERLRQNPKGIEAKRLRNNMLSSQPFCFNVFAFLALDLERATRLIQVLPGVPSAIRVTQVKCEYAPKTELHLQDNSAFDAWVEYALPDGKFGFIGIETKLTEPFSNKSYAYKEGYARWQRHANWWWAAGSEVNFPNREINQLWRNHLLAFSILYQPVLFMLKHLVPFSTTIRTKRVQNRSPLIFLTYTNMQRTLYSPGRFKM